MQEGPPSSMQTKAAPRTASSPPPSSPPALSPSSKTAAAGSKGVPAAHASCATALLTPTISSGASSSADDNEDADWAWDAGHVPWYCQPRKLAVVVLLLASLGLVLAGLVLQVVFRDPEGLTADYETVYTWLYFLAAFPPLALLLRWLCWRLYAVSKNMGQHIIYVHDAPDCQAAQHSNWQYRLIGTACLLFGHAQDVQVWGCANELFDCLQAAEYTAIREELYFLRPLKAKLAGLLFWMTVLLWFQVRHHSSMAAFQHCMLDTIIFSVRTAQVASPVCMHAEQPGSSLTALH